MNTGASKKVSTSLDQIQKAINKGLKDGHFNFTNALRDLIFLYFTPSDDPRFASNDLSEKEMQQLYSMVSDVLNAFPDTPERNKALTFLAGFQPLPTLTAEESAAALSNLFMVEFRHAIEQNDDKRIAELLSNAILGKNAALTQAIEILKSNFDYNLHDYLYAAFITNQENLINEILNHPLFKEPLQTFQERMASNLYLINQLREQVKHPTLFKDLFTIEIDTFDDFFDLITSRRTNFMDLDISQITPHPTKKQFDKLETYIKNHPDVTQAWQHEIGQFVKRYQPQEAKLGHKLATLDKSIKDSQKIYDVKKSKFEKTSKITRKLLRIAEKFAKKNNPVARYLEKRLHRKSPERLKTAIDAGTQLREQSIKENIHGYVLYELSGGNTGPLKQYIAYIDVNKTLSSNVTFLDALIELQKNDPENWREIEFAAMTALKQNKSYQDLAVRIADQSLACEYMFMNMTRPTNPYELWKQKLPQSDKMKLNNIIRGIKNMLSAKGGPIEEKIHHAQRALQPLVERQAQIEQEVKDLIRGNKEIFELDSNGDIKQFNILNPIIKPDADPEKVKAYQEKHQTLNQEAGQILKAKKPLEGAIKREKAKMDYARKFKDAIMGCTKEDGKLVRVPGIIEGETKPMVALLMENPKLMRYFEKHLSEIGKFEQDYRQKTNAAPHVLDMQQTTRPQAHTPQQKVFGPENYDPNNPEHVKAKLAGIKLNTDDDKKERKKMN